jgi:hypothetical protein
MRWYMEPLPQLTSGAHAVVVDIPSLQMAAVIFAVIFQTGAEGKSVPGEMERGGGGGGSLTPAVCRLKGRHHAFNDTCGAAIEEGCTTNRGNVVRCFYYSEIETLMDLVSIFIVRDKETIPVYVTWLKCLEGF